MSTEKPDFYKASWPEGQTNKRIALVTGGRRGIGKAIVEELLFVQRCQVIVADILLDGVEETFADVLKQVAIGPSGQKPLMFEKLDVTNADACQALIDKIVKEHGQIDILV